MIENSVYAYYDKTKAQKYRNFHANYYFDDSDFECNHIFDLVEFKTVFIDTKNEIWRCLNKKLKIDKSELKSTPKFTIPPAFTGNEDAYKEVANNNLDIHPTGRDYALIFT